MKSLWDDIESKKYTTDLDLRVYTSRLLGKMSSLVLHGGGNTSVKSTYKNLFGDTEDILYVKGSGWDLATIEAEGFAPVKMEMLLKMSELNHLDDTNMVKYQRLAMIDPLAPNPSVEAILHAIIPFKFVDHTHTDAVVTITNTKDGEKKIREIYGSKVLVIPYIMPGFVLAKLIYNMTRDTNWEELEGMVLLNHGLFTFNNSAKKSYEKMIELVNKAENFLDNNGARLNIKDDTSDITTLDLAQIRKNISDIKGCATISVLNDSNQAIYFSKQDISSISQQGPLTPDHVIRTKRIPIILSDNYKEQFDSYVCEYKKYFENNKTYETLLNPAPNFAILKNKGTLSFGKNIKEANNIKDINDHTFEAILKAECLGGYKALSAKDIFDVEYWELEQAKLKKNTTTLEFLGKIAIVTNGTNDVGISTVNMLNKKGATVIVLDCNYEVEKLFTKEDVLGIQCDLESIIDIQKAIDTIIKRFGGIDILVSNMSNSMVQQKLIQCTTPFLKLGIDPCIVILTNKKLNQNVLCEYNNRINTICINENVEYEINNISELVCSMAGKAFFDISDSTVYIGEKII